MSNFMNGFFRALSMPNSAENLYQAGKALSDWIDDHKKQSEARERFDQSVNIDAPVLRKKIPSATAGSGAGFADLYARKSSGSQTGNEGRKAQDGFEYVNRQQNETDQMLKELHQGLMNFMNSGNPDPNAAIGNRPITPRGRHVEDPVIDNRRR